MDEFMRNSYMILFNKELILWLNEYHRYGKQEYIRTCRTPCYFLIERHIYVSNITKNFEARRRMGAKD